MKGLFALFLLCMALVGCDSTVSRMPENSTPAQTIPTQAIRATTTTAPTVLPISATPTTTKIHVNPVQHPTIGDALSKWDMYYGQGKDSSVSGESLRQYTTATTTVVVGYNPQNTRVINVTVTGNNLSSPILPIDAHQIGMHGAENGQAIFYQSTLLAQYFPTSFFLDNSGQAVTPGTFTVFYKYATNGATIMAQINLGEIYGI